MSIIKYKIDMRELADRTGVCLSSINKYYNKKAYPSRAVAKKLEEVTGIQRINFLYPDEYGDPWKLLEGK